MVAEAYVDAGRMVHGAIVHAGMEQRAVCERLGLSPATLSRVCAGTLRPSPENISRLARLLGLNESALFVAFGLLPEPDGSGEALAMRYPGERFIETSVGATTAVLPFARLTGPTLFSEADVRVEREQRPYRLPDLILRTRDQLTLPQGPKFNRVKARLQSLQEGPASLVLRFQRTTFLNHLLTNHQMHAGAPVFLDDRWVAVADLLEPGGDRLSPLERALPSNHLGLNILLLDRHGDLLLAQRNVGASAYMPGVHLGLPAAGSMDWTDRDPFTGAFREMEEELGIADTELMAPGLLLMGLARYASRGGKPEAFFVGRAGVSAAELNERLSAPATTEPLPGTAQLPPANHEVVRLFNVPNTQASILDHLNGPHLDFTPETRVALSLYLAVRDAAGRRFHR